MSYHIKSGIDDAGDLTFFQNPVTLPVEESYDQVAVSEGSPLVPGLLTCGGAKDESPRVANSEVEVKVAPGLMCPAKYLFDVS